MTIQTRLLLFLLPPLIALIGGCACLLFLLFPSSVVPIGLSFLGLILVAISGVYALASKISAPLRRLNHSALSIAAGEYGESIEVSGPKEVEELANTLNTMSQCLAEQINRLKENSAAFQRDVGEAECARLLQQLILKKAVDHCKSRSIAVRTISLFSDMPRGLLLDYPLNAPHLLEIRLVEAEEEGLEGLYTLLTRANPSLAIQIDLISSRLTWSGMGTPLLYSLQKNRFVPPSEHILEMGDLLLVPNQGLLQFFKGSELLERHLSKVLKLFASDGLDSLVPLLQKEISFATKRKEVESDLHLFCFQLLL
jgi:HAMP domain-containing protein